jgi:hypothetical protein
MVELELIHQEPVENYLGQTTSVILESYYLDMDIYIPYYRIFTRYLQ